MHDLSLALRLADRVLTIEKCEGAQGADGSFSATGTATLAGELAIHAQGQGIALGMFTKVAGLHADVLGTADIDAAIGGTVLSPAADVTVEAKDGGIEGSTFDRLTGKESLGGGDIKLFFVTGLYLRSIWEVLFFLILSCVLGIGCSLVWRKGKIPFGPAIAAAFFLMLLFGEQLTGWYRGLWLL